VKSTDTIHHQAVAITEDTTPQRDSLMNALSRAEQVVSQLHTLPTDVDVRLSSSDRVYSLHLFFSQNSPAVLEFARLFDAEVTSSPSTYGPGVFLEAVARYEGISVKGWSVADQAPDPDGPRERTVDEDPITYALTPQAEALCPDTLREAAQHVRNVQNAGALIATSADQLLDEEADRLEAEGQ
jgi:hypothetical protein